MPNFLPSFNIFCILVHITFTLFDKNSTVWRIFILYSAIFKWLTLALSRVGRVGYGRVGTRWHFWLKGKEEVEFLARFRECSYKLMSSLNPANWTAMAGWQFARLSGGRKWFNSGRGRWVAVVYAVTTYDVQPDVIRSDYLRHNAASVLSEGTPPHSAPQPLGIQMTR